MSGRRRMAKRKTIAQLSDLTPDASNANKGTERGRYMVEASLTETGAGRSIVADKDGRIIAGNKTLEAWAGMGGAVKIVETDGQELVVVQRTDLDLSDPKGKARKLAYYDNRAGQVGLEWDAEQLLADVNAGVDLAAMFKADEIAELLAGVKGGEADAEPQIDQAEELNKKWQVKTGDLWKIGAHRLLCGDSTKAADVARVMGGERADCVCTDPPYGIGDLMEGGTWAKKQDAQFEKMRDWDARTDQKFFDMVAALSVPSVVWGGNYFLTPPSRCWLVWDKPEFPTMSSAELAWTNVNANTKRIECGRTHQADGAKEHATQKPLAVITWSLSFLPVGIVYEPFAGSGTTLVACENLGRKCRAVEISPAYCAVILERMAQAFPKLEITRDDGAG